MELKESRVTLLPLHIQHAPALVEAASSRATYKYTIVPQNLTEAREYIEKALELERRGVVIPFATSVDGRIVGSTRFLSLEYWNGSKVPSVCEIGGTWLAESVQRTFVNTEAKLLMLTQAFEVWRVARVTLKTDARNEKSRRNIERLGARFDGVLRAERPATDGGIRDTAFYSILSGEWPDVRDALVEKKNRATKTGKDRRAT